MHICTAIPLLFDVVPATVDVFMKFWG